MSCDDQVVPLLFANLRTLSCRNMAKKLLILFNFLRGFLWETL